MIEAIMAVMVVAILWAVLGPLLRRRGDMFCSQCGTIGKPVTRTRGSLVIEIAAWMMLIVPGLLYSLWRHTTRRDVCRACGGEALLPPNSPVAEKMRKELAGEKT